MGIVVGTHGLGEPGMSPLILQSLDREILNTHGLVNAIKSKYRIGSGLVLELLNVRQGSMEYCSCSVKYQSFLLFSSSVYCSGAALMSGSRPRHRRERHVF